jgi:hypothetical protein
MKIISYNYLSTFFEFLIDCDSAFNLDSYYFNLLVFFIIKRITLIIECFHLSF